MPAPESSPTTAESVAHGDAVDLSFGAAEEQVTGEWGVGWLDPFPDDERFEYTPPEEEFTGYFYRDTANECTIGMELRRLADHEIPDDDRLISDTMLAMTAFGSSSVDDLAEIASWAEDDALWQEEKAATIDFRALSSFDEELGSVVVAARGFGAMAAGMILTITCPAGEDARAEYQQVKEENSRIFVRSPTNRE